MQPIRQGDVILISVQQPDAIEPDERLSHLTLAEGEVTGHRHRISAGQAELYLCDDTLYLQVSSDTAVLTHEEHQPIQVPHGLWMVRIQREYEPEGWRHVAD